MNITLQLRWGGTIDNPTTEQLLSALADLDKDDEEHPYTWLTCQSDGKDWILCTYAKDGIALRIWDSNTNPETYQDFDLFSVTREQISEMWFEMQRGELHKIQARPWEPRP